MPAAAAAAAAGGSVGVVAAAAVAAATLAGMVADVAAAVVWSLLVTVPPGPAPAGEVVGQVGRSVAIVTRQASSVQTTHTLTHSHIPRWKATPAQQAA